MRPCVGDGVGDRVGAGENIGDALTVAGGVDATVGCGAQALMRSRATRNRVIELP